MLLRSSSTPIRNSWLPHSKESSSSEPELQVLQRTKSVTLPSSFHSPVHDHTKKAIRTTTQPLSPETNALQNSKNIIPIVPSHTRNSRNPSANDQGKEESKPSTKIQRLFPSSGLQGRLKTKDDHQEKENSGLPRLALGGMGNGSGGRIHGGGGSESYGSDSTDAYYQQMIEANPDNPLLLGNYARFLKEVQGDLAKAEEFCERAILANPSDGSILAVYADLLWQSQKDAQRAESYFDRAVQNAPDDCYILASYARFLWNVEDGEGQEEQKQRELQQLKTDHLQPKISS